MDLNNTRSIEDNYGFVKDISALQQSHYQSKDIESFNIFFAEFTDEMRKDLSQLFNIDEQVVAQKSNKELMDLLFEKLNQVSSPETHETKKAVQEIPPYFIINARELDSLFRQNPSMKNIYELGWATEVWNDFNNAVRNNETITMLSPGYERKVMEKGMSIINAYDQNDLDVFLSEDIGDIDQLNEEQLKTIQKLYIFPVDFLRKVGFADTQAINNQIELWFTEKIKENNAKHKELEKPQTHDTVIGKVKSWFARK